jgi:hypothetical protein
VVITVGVLFLLHQMHGGHFYFGNTWPVLLLVIGLIQLASALSSREGHVENVPTVGAPPTVPPENPPQAPLGGQGH